MAEALNQYAQRADEAKMGYLDFLDLVLSEELAVRDDRRFRQGLRLSKLPHHKTLDDYDFSFQPDLDPRKVKDLATLSFVEAKANARPARPRPESARPTPPSPSPSRRVGPATRPTSPASTTWSATSRPPKPQAA
ncbi:ATP-binding protein [Streptomyces sp. ME19-01-6]|nr:ATP-binding protein [Streptomyces sp. ME19-01-6]